jgi:nonsense-mediated mRNA decay protein 3
MKGGYFEAILQVRKDNVDMTKSEIELSDEVVYKRASEYGGGYVSKKEMKHGGVDYYISDKKMAASAAKFLSEIFRGETSVSPSLTGMKDGREVYRNTYLVRIPEYSKNRYVEIDGRVYRVFDMGKKIGVRDMVNGGKKYFYRDEMSKARVLDVDEMEAIVVSKEEGEVQILDPESYRTVVISKPEGVEIGDSVRIIKWKGKIYLTGD